MLLLLRIVQVADDVFQATTHFHTAIADVGVDGGRMVLLWLGRGEEGTGLARPRVVVVGRREWAYSHAVRVASL